MEQWHKQLIRNLFHYSSDKINTEVAFTIKHQHVPDHLYKYRQFTPNHLEVLKKNVLWMSSPDRFNDPYDAVVSFDTDRFLIEDQSVQEFLNTFELAANVVKAGGKWQPKNLVRPVQQGKWRQKILMDLQKNENFFGKNEIVPVEIVRVIDNIMKKHAEENMKRMSDSLRQGYSVLSMSKTCFDKLMWAHYSDAHRGFAIEYDFSSLPATDLRKRLCFPVFYTKKLRDATRYMARTDMADFNNFFGMYMCLIKQANWAHEQEWRIIHPIGPSHANRELVMQEPSAIILGSQVKQANEDMMRSLCDSRKIPIRRMIQRPGSFDLEITDIIS